MSNKNLCDKFKILRDKLISKIYLAQLLEWTATIYNKDLDLLSELEIQLESDIKEAECSNELSDLVDEIICRRSTIDDEIVKEALIIKDRIKTRKEVGRNIELAKAKIKVRRAYILAKQSGELGTLLSDFDTLITLNKQQYGNYKQLCQTKIKDVSYEEIDEMFRDIKTTCVPLLIKPETYKKCSATTKEKEVIIDYLLDILLINKQNIDIKNSNEYFMLSFGKTNVKLSLNFEEKNLLNFLKKSCHEMGHALYELNNSPTIHHTFLSGGASTSFHEAIAYFFEHYLGDNPEFQNIVVNKLKKSIGITELKTPTAIRTLSNNTNYPVHVLIRYELEKDLINNDLTADTLVEAWNKKFRDYLGININNVDVFLQDPHWFNNQFAYFPCYVLGRAYASQIISTLNKDQIDEQIKTHNLNETINFLSNGIFRYGASKKPNEILKTTTGEVFNKKFYIQELSMDK